MSDKARVLGFMGLLALIAFAQLDRVNEAAMELVGEEARSAWQWLQEVGRLEPTTTAAEPTAARTRFRDLGEVRGKTQWADLDASPPPRLQILLDGVEPSTQGKRYWVGVPLNQPYQFTSVVPGRYRISVRVGLTRLWDTTVEVKAGTPTVLDLTQATSIAPPNALDNPA